MHQVSYTIYRVDEGAKVELKYDIFETSISHTAALGEIFHHYHEHTL